MSRWAPDARERLVAAAFDLFEEHGYEATTVAQISERASLNRATFFRHFADKREVILAGEDALSDLFIEGIRSADSAADVYRCLRSALECAAQVMTPQQRVTAGRRIAVVAANPELQERGELKFARITQAMTTALRDRGIEELAARLGAEIGLLAFRIGFERWMLADDSRPLAALALTALEDLRARAHHI
jgi:AcrR family transcriptional regulator